MEYRFELKKTSKKIQCPSCGRKTFKQYVDKKTNREFSEKHGRCERVNSCGYILYPKIDKEDDWTPPQKPYIAPKPIEYISKEVVESTFNEFKSNVFIQFLVKTFGGEIAMQLQADYNIGTAKGGGTIFWQQDNLGRFRTGKVIYYGENGKRIKDKLSWFVHKKIREDFNYQQCLFGLHLVTTDKPVALCESEKSAILMSVYKPEFTWVASGGSEMLNLQRLTELKRLDKVFPDSGQFEKWEQKTRHFTGRQMDISVDRAVEGGLLEDGSDIYDLTQIEICSKK